MPRWIDHEASKADRTKAARQAHDALVERHRLSAGERTEFARIQAKDVAERAEPSRLRGIRPGTIKRPDFSDADLWEALFDADDTPRHLRYPHLLILRERGFIVPVLGDDPYGRFAVPIHRGDVITEEGRKWLKDKT